MKLNKKILISLFSLFGVIAITTPFVVSCSSGTPSPIQTISTNISNDLNFTINNGIRCEPGFEIGGRKFTTSPGFDKNDLVKQQATSVFDVIGAFSQWVYGASNSIATVISREPTTKERQNPITIASKTNGTLDYALAAYIGSGKGTYRLGIKTITSSITPETIYNNVVEYIEPTTENIDQLQEVQDGVNPNENQQISFGDVVITFGWWRSEGSNKIKWISESDFSKLEPGSDYMQNAVSAPEWEYTLTLSGLSADINTYSQQKIGDKNYWYPTGQIRINTEKDASPFYTTSMSGTEIQKLLDNIDIANQVAAGDFKNQTFADFIKNDEKGKEITMRLPFLVS